MGDIETQQSPFIRLRAAAQRGTSALWVGGSALSRVRGANPVPVPGRLV